MHAPETLDGGPQAIITDAWRSSRAHAEAAAVVYLLRAAAQAVVTPVLLGILWATHAIPGAWAAGIATVNVLVAAATVLYARWLKGAPLVIVHGTVRSRTEGSARVTGTVAWRSVSVRIDEAWRLSADGRATRVEGAAYAWRFGLKALAARLHGRWEFIEDLTPGATVALLVLPSNRTYAQADAALLAAARAAGES